MRSRTAIMAIVCLIGAWYYALSIASVGGFAFKPGMVNDFYPLWNVSRAISSHIDPYGPEITEQDQVAAYGATAKSAGIQNDQQFPYPIPAAFPFLPFGLVSFRAADRGVFCLFVAIVALSTAWLRGAWDRATLLYGVLVLASYPVIVALQMRQPTILFFGLAVGSLALVRSGHLLPAGLVAALSASKPQIALSTLVPMLIWSFARWHERKRFAISLLAFSTVLLCLASALVPGWIPEWFSALHAYSHYVQPSFAVLLLGQRLGLSVSIALLVGLSITLWSHRKRDLLFQAALSASILYLIGPFWDYNAILLLIPIVWIADNFQFIKNCGTSSQIALALVQVALAGLWLAAPLGALLIHTTSQGTRMAWALGDIMVSPLLVSVVALMAVQCFTVHPASQTVLVAAPDSATPRYR
jgi:hypothetical protein